MGKVREFFNHFKKEERDGEYYAEHPVYNEESFGVAPC